AHAFRGQRYDVARLYATPGAIAAGIPLLHPAEHRPPARRTPPGVPREVHQHRLAHEVTHRDEPPRPAVGGVVAVVPHHEEVVLPERVVVVRAAAASDPPGARRAGPPPERPVAARERGHAPS